MPILRAFAVLFALLAVSNLLKPLELSAQTGFVFMGRRLEGTPNLIAAWSFAALLAAYAAALWREKAAALPLGLAYAAYVSANLFLFSLRMPAPTGNARLFGLVYTVVAIGGAGGGGGPRVGAGGGGMGAGPSAAPGVPGPRWCAPASRRWRRRQAASPCAPSHCCSR
jgi:hypothetical protein